MPMFTMSHATHIINSWIAPRNILSLLIVLNLLCIEKSWARTTYLFSAEAEGGIHGAAVDSMRAGEATQITESSLNSINNQIAEISYDHHSSYLIARQTRPDKLFYSPLCNDPTNVPTVVFNASSTFPIINTEYRGYALDCPDCHAGPFALFDNKIYFLVVGDFGLPPLKKSIVQLRVLQTCNECKLNMDKIITRKEFRTPYLFNCSQIVAEVFSEPIDFYVHIHLKAGRGLRVVKSEQGLQFFFQVFVSKLASQRQHIYADLQLYRATDSGTAEILHTEKVLYAQYSQWSINALASVDYKDGLLCWSGADRLYCGELDHNWTLLNIQRLLYPGESVALRICRGSNTDLLVYITGVAISEALDVWDKRVIFFGCYPQFKGVGGTGMIKISPDGKDKQVFPVALHDGEKPLHSGSMFVLDDLPSECAHQGKLEICLDPPESVHEPQNLLKDKPEQQRSTEMTLDEQTENKMEKDASGTKESPDPEIIVVESVKSMDEFEKETNYGKGNPDLDMFLQVVTFIMLFVYMFLP